MAVHIHSVRSIWVSCYDYVQIILKAMMSSSWFYPSVYWMLTKTLSTWPSDKRMHMHLSEDIVRHHTIIRNKRSRTRTVKPTFLKSDLENISPLSFILSLCLHILICTQLLRCATGIESLSGGCRPLQLCWSMYSTHSNRQTHSAA